MSALSAEARLAVVGLAVGIALGMAGGFLPRGPSQDVLWVVSGVGYVVGAGLGAAVLARRGWTAPAVGLALFALAESVVMGGASRATDPGAASAFASGVSFYAGAVLVASLPRGFPVWSRVAGALAAVPFAAHALLRSAGQDLPVGTSAYAYAGYMLLTVAMVGWMVLLLKDSADGPGAPA